jgi:hypothetical protein
MQVHRGGAGRADRLCDRLRPARGPKGGARTELNSFLDDAQYSGRLVAGYGAASRGTTLLNIAGVGADRLPFIVDRAPAKHGKLLPRARIPVHAPAELSSARPDDIMILPWPSAGQITEQLAYVRDWGAICFVAVPCLEFVP